MHDYLARAGSGRLAGAVVLLWFCLKTTHLFVIFLSSYDWLFHWLRTCVVKFSSYCSYGLSGNQQWNNKVGTSLLEFKNHWEQTHKVKNERNAKQKSTRRHGAILSLRFLLHFSHIFTLFGSPRVLNTPLTHRCGVITFVVSLVSSSKRRGARTQHTGKILQAWFQKLD